MSNNGFIMPGEPLKPASDDPKENINARVIAVQKADGTQIDADWWRVNVEDNVKYEGTESSAWDCFVVAYDRDFPKDMNGHRHIRPEIA